MPVAPGLDGSWCTLVFGWLLKLVYEWALAHSDPAHVLLKREVLASKSVDDLTTNCSTTAAIIVITIIVRVMFDPYKFD